MSARFSLVFVSALAACGGGGDDKPVDAGIDARASMVMRVDPCPGTVNATVTTNAGFSYMPAATTITQGQVVKFTMDPTHDVAPLDATSDPGLVVPLGAERCYRFTGTGTFRFKCTPHGFTGMVTVN